MSASAYTVEPWPPHELSEEPLADLLRSSKSLMRLVSEERPLDSKSLRTTREVVIRALVGVFEQFVAETAVQKGLAASVADGRSFGGQVRISGSYRMGITSEGDDIDAICIAPRHVDNDDFFKGLSAMLAKHPYVDAARPIEGARVPLIDLVMRGIPIDLLFCRLERRTVPTAQQEAAQRKSASVAAQGGSAASAQSQGASADAEFDIMDDRLLIGADEASVLSLNGPRCTEQLALLVPPGRFGAYKDALRALRLWCKRRGMYGNKFGFLGGINLSIMLNYIVQRYPAFSPAGLVLRFFICFARWEWPRHFSAQRTIYHRSDFTTPVRVWDPESDLRARSDKMPILTPCFPVTNSTVNVNASTLTRMKAEFLRGVAACFHAVLRLGAGAPALESTKPNDVADALKQATAAWDVLFRPSEFFYEFPLYLAVHVWVDDAPLAEEDGDGELDEQGGGAMPKMAPSEFATVAVTHQRSGGKMGPGATGGAASSFGAGETGGSPPQEPASRESIQLCNAWSDFVASRMRQLAVIMERDRLPFQIMVPWPKAVQWEMHPGYERTGILSGNDGRPDVVEWGIEAEDATTFTAVESAPILEAGKGAGIPPIEQSNGSEPGKALVAKSIQDAGAESESSSSSSGTVVGSAAAASGYDTSPIPDSSAAVKPLSKFGDCTLPASSSLGTDAGALEGGGTGSPEVGGAALARTKAVSIPALGRKGRSVQTYFVGLRPLPSVSHLRFPENLMPDFIQGTLISGYSDFDPRMRASFQLLRDEDLPRAVYPEGQTAAEIEALRQECKRTTKQFTWPGLPDQSAREAHMRINGDFAAPELQGSGRAGVVWAGEEQVLTAVADRPQSPGLQPGATGGREVRTGDGDGWGELKRQPCAPSVPMETAGAAPAAATASARVGQAGSKRSIDPAPPAQTERLPCTAVGTTNDTSPSLGITLEGTGEPVLKKSRVDATSFAREERGSAAAGGGGGSAPLDLTSASLSRTHKWSKKKGKKKKKAGGKMLVRLVE